MKCIDCSMFKPERGDMGLCQLNPPILLTGRSPLVAEAFYQPLTTEDGSCGSFTGAIEEVKVETKSATQRTKTKR